MTTERIELEWIAGIWLKAGYESTAENLDRLAGFPCKARPRAIAAHRAMLARLIADTPDIDDRLSKAYAANQETQKEKTMNNDDVDYVLRGMRKLLPGDATRDVDAQTSLARLGHCAWMCEEALQWPADRLEKKFRWLGYVQGILVSYNVMTIEELKQINLQGKKEGHNDA